MSPDKKQLARKLFRLRIHEAYGFQFEDLFADIMSYSRRTFCKIQPYGNHGDRGNDGYEKEHGRYFQVFSPKDPATSKSYAIKKAAEDFGKKLIPYWHKFCPVKEFFFVFNDKYHGSFIDLEETLSCIKSTHNLDCADSFTAKDLEQELMQLDEDLILMIISGLPNIESSDGLDYSVLGEVIDHIQNSPPNWGPGGKPAAPDFEEKILFNGLSYTGDWLRIKQREVWQVDDYLIRNSNFAKQAIRDHLAGYYAESLNITFPAEIQKSEYSDSRFIYILNRIAPETGSHARDKLKKDAALILMSKYFESCDIFEEPTSVTP